MPYMDIEDTRQPPDPPTHAPCDRCGAWCDVDDMEQFEGAGKYGGDLWLCKNCAEDYREEARND